MEMAWRERDVEGQSPEGDEYSGVLRVALGAFIGGGHQWLRTLGDL